MVEPAERRRVGVWFAHEARAERASAQGFRRLLEELKLHAAPPIVLDGLRRAIRDEQMHADALTGLARRHGVRTSWTHRAELPKPAPRDLAHLTADVVATGCIADTWAALRARHQARHAADREVRMVMGAIASDETRHAELAFAIHRWAWTRLRPADRVVVDRVGRSCVAELRRTIEEQPALPAALGLPPLAHATRIVDVVSESIWTLAA